MSKQMYEEIDKFINRIKDAVYNPIKNLDIEMWWSREPIPFDKRMDGLHKELNVGDCWGELWDCAWMKFTGKVPDGAKGKKVVLMIDVGGEGCVFDSEGTPVRGITCVDSQFDHTFGMPGKRVLQFLSCANGGEKVEIWLEAGMNDLFGEYKNDGRIVQACIATCDEDLRGLYYDLYVITDLYQSIDDYYRKDELAGIIGRSESVLTDITPENIAEARRIIAYGLNQKNREDRLTFSAIGHAHIDLAWLWPIRETIRKGGRTFATVLELMERYPDYKFGASQPQLYLWIKERYPNLYEKIREKISEGRWEVQGALWVESDTNIPGAEALVRQIMFGKKFYKDEFDIDVKTLWLPDAFGFSPVIPQLMKLSGTEYFVTIKMTWNLVNTFPYNTFLWKGIDGSIVLAHIPPEGTYNSPASPSSLIKGERDFKQKDTSNNALTLFGIGDGGGGPGSEHLERIDREHDLDGMPKVKYEYAVDFFRRIEQLKPKLPVWYGEMYLENHQGTLTSQAKSKYYNRKLELALRNAECSSRAAELAAGFSYPEESLNNIWKEMLLYQFHDILPGSSIKRVYDESRERYESMLERVNNIYSQALDKLCQCIDTIGLDDPRIAFNNTSWECNEWIKTKKGWIMLNIPAMGYAAFDGADSGSMEFSVRVQNNIVENDKVKVKLNDNGFVDSIVLKSNNMEMLRKGCQGNDLTVYQDCNDAWNINTEYLSLPAEHPILVHRKVHVDGPKVVVNQIFTYGTSRIEQDMVLTDGSARIDFITKVNWDEKSKMLRVKFPASIDTPRAACEIQFGHIFRNTYTNTSWDMAKSEVSNQKWVDVSVPTAGLALLNDCKYGVRVKDCILDLNLLRSTDYPGADADKGIHLFTYSLFPHEGDHITGGVVCEGYRLNIPVQTIECKHHEGYMPKSGSLVAISDSNIVVEAVKRSEDCKATIIRLYEASGAYRKATVKPGFPISHAAVVNLLEQDAVQLDIKCDSVELDFHPFEIKTLYLGYVKERC